MTLRYLYGPVAARFVEQNLQQACESGECLAFHPGDEVDEVVSKVDFIVLDLHYTSIPPCLWQAPVPLIGLAQDSNLLWHGYRKLLRHVDLVLTDTAGVEKLALEGIAHARIANLVGLEKAWEQPAPGTHQRDID